LPTGAPVYSPDGLADTVPLAGDAAGFAGAGLVVLLEGAFATGVFTVGLLVGAGRAPSRIRIVWPG
jgi:hypothetical protein